jgi:hypothetical protein
LREHWWPALSISPGAGSPCQPASLLGTRHPDSSGWRTVREGGPAWWGARPVELSVPERARRYHWGTRQGSAPTHPGSFRQSPLLGGGAHSHPDSFGCSAPMRETDSAREAVLESLVELNPTGSFVPPSVGALTWRGLTGPCPSGVGCPVRVRAPEIPRGVAGRGLPGATAVLDLD